MADVKPTPTQAENDRAAMGEHVMTHEPDGSPEEPSVHAAAQEAAKKHQERHGKAEKHATASGSGAGYSTRASKAE
jgi:hypothetical protein